MSDKSLKHLLERNREWAENVIRDDPEFFARLSKLQEPEYLWIGCSDSRVPANQIMGLLPGEVFVHRNIANVVVHSDLNCLSVIQYAVDILKVKHIIVCGHYGCGGIQAALDDRRVGLADNWLCHIKDIKNDYSENLDNLKKEQAWDKLCELNVIEQVMNICHTTIIRDAWAREQEITVHGWVYSLKDGLVRDLGMQASDYDEALVNSKAALKKAFA